MIKNSELYVHNYKLRDTDGHVLNEHGGIWLFELNKFSVKQIESEDQRWLKFFKDGEQLNDSALPEWMTTQEMRQAMNTLNLFSEKERRYFEYQARQEYLREQRTIQMEMERAKIEKEDAMQQTEAAKQREEAAKQREKVEKLQKEEAIKREAAALQEIERLKALLAQQK